MCGIAGIFSFAGRSDTQLQFVVRMANAMKHRGPDDEGYVTFGSDGEPREFFGHDTPKAVREVLPQLIPALNVGDLQSTVALGHRRLSILDLSPGGHQPMRDSTGRYWIVFNGEIYNYRELRHELISAGYQFHSESDTEVILAAYSRWQENCLMRFNGDFSLAIWDRKDQSLFCARDRIGIKPFYYVFENGRFIFGSDIKTLLASGLHKAEPDREGLYLSMAFGIAPRPITAFKGIRALEQAHWIRLHSDGRFEKSRYWQIPVGTQVPNMKEAEAVELIEEQLKRAVSRRLAGDVPVGTFMSGGIDSTTISAMAAQQHPGIKAITLGYQDDASDMDEVPQAKATARLHPMQHIVKRVDPCESLRDLQEWVRGYEEPHHSIAVTHVISKVVAEHQIKVVLNGLGGDELFAGYGHYHFHSIPRIPSLRFLAPLCELLNNKKINTGLKLLSYETPDRLHTALFCHWPDAELRKLFVNELHPKLKTVDLVHHLYADNIKFSDSIEAMSFMDLMNYVGNHFVHRVDQFTMAHSIEGRFPFLDHELIEAAYRVPSQLKINKQNQKYILRKVAEKYIAQNCLTMKKKGFGLPLNQWMRGPLNSLVADQIHNLIKRPEVNPNFVRGLFEEWKKSDSQSSHVWQLVALELWFQEFIDF